MLPIGPARVAASRETVLRLLVEVELWPTVFPHIQAARLIAGHGAWRRFSLRASWHGAPLTWRVIQTVDDPSGIVTFRTVGWLGHRATHAFQVTATQDGATPTCLVTVSVDRQGRPVRWAGAETVFGQPMLARLKAVAEGASLAGRA